MLSPAITDVSAVRLSHSARSSFAWNVPVATDCYMLTPRMGIEDQQLRSSVARGGAALRTATTLLLVNPLRR